MIEGIGGAFLFSNEPEKLAAWYRDCLGMLTGWEGGHIFQGFESWDLTDPTVKRTTAWTIMKVDHDLKGKPRTAKINYRVRSMDAILAHLNSQGVKIDKTEQDDYGKFATLHDPEGNVVELWEEC